MDTDTVIWIIVAVVVVLALLTLAALAIRKKQARDAEQRRGQAQELRQQATSTAPGVTEAQLRTEEADAEARLMRTEAERAEQRAAEEKRQLAAEEAQREDLIRDADRLDPDVKHRSKDYRPGDPGPTDDSGGAHRA